MTEAQKLKTAALCWLRFIKQMPYVATEVGSYSADVAGADLKTLIEIEVKTNEADIRRDFQNKQEKHRIYSGKASEEPTRYNVGRSWEHWVPNRFFYLVPLSLEKYALEFIGEKNPLYGVMVYEERGLQRRLAESIRIARKAGYLHHEGASREAHIEFLKRMGSDLCHLHLTRGEMEDAFDRMKALSKQCVELRDSVDDPA
jgi:hypothetical protein